MWKINPKPFGIKKKFCPALQFVDSTKSLVKLANLPLMMDERPKPGRDTINMITLADKIKDKKEQDKVLTQ